MGGDWYDMIPLPNGRIALVIGDVQGHDVRAAGLMGQLRIALRAYASEGHRPDAVLSRASRFLSGLTESYDLADDEDRSDATRFATCLYAEVDPEAGTLDIARAGHPDPVVISVDGTAVIRQTAGGLPLGVENDADYPTTRVVLGPGETIMLCTDGLIETGGHDMATGWARLRPVLEKPVDDLEELAEALVQAVHGPGSHYTTGPLVDRREDDIAVLVLRREVARTRRIPGRRSAMTIAQAEPERIAAARQQLRALLHDWADAEQVDSAELMVSEMATNVLVHTDGDALLVAEVTGEPGERRLRVEVADASDELPHKRRPGEMASSGRGLVLMEMLADAWGWTRGARGSRSGSSCTSRRSRRNWPPPDHERPVTSGPSPPAAYPLRSSPITPTAAAHRGTASSMPSSPATLAPAVSAIMIMAGCIWTVRLWMTGWSTWPSSTCTATTTPSAQSAITMPRSASATSTATAPEMKAPR